MSDDGILHTHAGDIQHIARDEAPDLTCWRCCFLCAPNLVCTEYARFVRNRFRFKVLCTHTHGKFSHTRWYVYSISRK